MSRRLRPQQQKRQPQKSGRAHRTPPLGRSNRRARLKRAGRNESGGGTEAAEQEAYVRARALEAEVEGGESEGDEVRGPPPPPPPPRPRARPGELGRSSRLPPGMVANRSGSNGRRSRPPHRRGDEGRCRDALAGFRNVNCDRGPEDVLCEPGGVSRFGFFF